MKPKADTCCSILQHNRSVLLCTLIKFDICFQQDAVEDTFKVCGNKIGKIIFYVSIPTNIYTNILNKIAEPLCNFQLTDFH